MSAVYRSYVSRLLEFCLRNMKMRTPEADRSRLGPQGVFLAPAWVSSKNQTGGTLCAQRPARPFPPKSRQQPAAFLTDIVDLIICLLDQRLYLNRFPPHHGPVQKVREDPPQKSGDRQEDHQP